LPGAKLIARLGEQTREGIEEMLTKALT